MDVPVSFSGPFLGSLLNMLVWLVPLLVLVTLLTTARVRVWMGKHLVRLAVDWMLGRKTSRRLHDVDLTMPSGTVHIDHLIIAPQGIFVLQVHTMRGKIAGGHQRVWTQILSPLKTHKFESPIYQNQKHLDALRTVLDVAGEHLRPVITFVGPSTFATPMPDNVTRGLGFLRHIKLFRRGVFGPMEVEALAARIGMHQFHQANRPLQPTEQEQSRSLAVEEPTGRRKCPTCGSARSEMQPS